MTTRCLLAMCTNNLTDGNDGVPVWTPEQKRVARAAEKAGKVTVAKTGERFGGYEEWRVRLAS